MGCALLGLLVFGASAPGEPTPDPTRLKGPRDIAADPAGNLWVVDSLGFMRITRDGHFSRPVDAPGATAITRGPDGAMWFTVYPMARIGRIASDAHVDYFNEGLSSPAHDITRGPDGNLWVTESEGRIARITPAGQVTEFSKGLRAKSAPVSITSGPDGNVWFTDAYGAIGRITPGGTIDEFPLPRTESGYLDAIAAGTGNTLWFAYDNRVGRITTAGRIHFFKTPFSSVSGIALGTDGAMWLGGHRDGSRTAAAVGRITPRGQVRLFERGLSGSFTGAITRAADGTLWVTEVGRSITVDGVDAIARVSVHHSAVELPPTPHCVVPRLVRLPLGEVQTRLYYSFCRVDASSRRAGRRARTVALGAYPPAGSVLPFDTRVQVRFGHVPPLPTTCGVPFGGLRQAVTPKVLVFSYTDYNGGTGESKTHYGACLRPHGRLQRITVSEDLLDYYEEASGFRIAGSFVAYTYFTGDHYNNSSISLNVYDVRRRRGIFGQGVESHDAGGYPGDAELRDYVVSEHGAVAWLIAQGEIFHLYAHGRSGGGTRELDSGASLSGLGFSGDTLHWTSDSQPRSTEVR